MDDPKGAKKWCVILPKFFDWNLSCCIYFIKFDLLCLAMLYMNLLGMFLFSLIQVSLSFLRFVKWISFSILKLYLYEIYFNLQLKNACIGDYLLISDKRTLSIPPEKEFFWCFQGAWKWSIVLKWVKYFC